MSERFAPDYCTSSINLQQPIQWPLCTKHYPDALRAYRHNNQSARGHSPRISTRQALLAVLGGGRHNPTMKARRHQQVAGEVWRVGATSGIGSFFFFFSLVDLRLMCVCVVVGTTCNAYVVVFGGKRYSRFV